MSRVLRRAGFPRIGPTAHYTGYVWTRNGLSHPELETREGHVLFDALQPGMLVSRAAGFRAARVSPAVDVAGEDRERGSRLANILEASINLPPEASTT